MRTGRRDTPGRLTAPADCAAPGVARVSGGDGRAAPGAAAVPGALGALKTPERREHGAHRGAPCCEASPR